MPPHRPRLLRRPSRSLLRRPSPRAAVITGAVLVVVALATGLLLPRAVAPDAGTPPFTVAGEWSLLDLQRHLAAGDVAAVTATGEPGAADAGLVAKTTDGQLVPIALSTDAGEAARALAALGYEDVLTAEAWASVRTARPAAAPQDPVRIVLGFLLPLLLLGSIGLLVWGVLRGGVRGPRRGTSFAVVLPAKGRAGVAAGASTSAGSASGAPASPSVRLDDVAGCDEAKHELTEVIDFLREPDRFARLGATMPRGVLLHGPPGTG